MLVRQAKEAARQWVLEEGRSLPHFYGAFFAGSTNWMPEDTPLPAASDVDVKIVLESPEIPGDFRKFRYSDVVLEIAYAPVAPFQSPDAILGDYYTAGHFTRPNIILDPAGQLTRIQAAVAQDFAKRRWVSRRCEHARAWFLTSLQWLHPAAPLPDQVFAWVYPTSVLAHLVQVAALQNPTVRKCFVASSQALAQYGHASLHEAMLGLLGSADLSLTQVQALHRSCLEVFDVAKAIITTAFFGSGNISELGRPIADEGIREIIESGYHREAVFWILVTHTWCQKALDNDASVAVKDTFTPRYQHLLAELGITSAADLQAGIERITALLPRVGEVCDAMMSANPAIVD